MNKIIFSAGLIFTLSVQAFGACACYFSMGTTEGQLPSNVNSLVSLVTKEQEEIIKKYSVEIMPIVNEIAELSEKKEQLIKQIKEIKKYSILGNKETIFIMKQEGKLIDNAIEIEGLE